MKDGRWKMEDGRWKIKFCATKAAQSKISNMQDHKNELL